MITLSDFQNYLSQRVPLPQRPRDHLNEHEQQLLKWVASLPAQTEAQQASQLEQILTELTIADLDDPLRLKLLSIITNASDRLITALHKHYSYELGALNKEQLVYINQVKSLYYLTILAYDGVIQRENSALNYQRRSQATHGWRRLLTLTKTPPVVLAAAIYQSLITYQKLLCEKDISYQKPSKHLWSAFNHLYYSAHQIEVAHLDLSAQVVTKQALSIHELYVQLCLHSLLNICAMRRPNMLLVQRLLPLWSTYISATVEPQSNTRVFVDLEGETPPEYLTASSAINPYDEQQHCLFIDLEPLTAYLYQRQQDLLDSNNEAIEYQLVNKVLMAINHRYVKRQTVVPTKYSPKQQAEIISSFNNIHYKVAGEHSLMSIIAAKQLPIEQLPRYDTQPKKDHTNSILNVETFDSTDTISEFRVLHLLYPQDLAQSQAAADKKTTKSSSTLSMEFSDKLTLDVNTAPPPLQLMSLFLLCRPNNQDKLKWSLGMVRWLNFESKYIEVEWQVFGHVLTACALRIDNRGQRSQNFMPAFMVAGDEELQTEFTLIVPPYHFQSNDKVMLRINDNQKPLRLLHCLINSKEFSQYKVMQL